MILLSSGGGGMGGCRCVYSVFLQIDFQEEGVRIPPPTGILCRLQCRNESVHFWIALGHVEVDIYFQDNNISIDAIVNKSRTIPKNVVIWK